jgi:hypothetical protein
LKKQMIFPAPLVRKIEVAIDGGAAGVDVDVFEPEVGRRKGRVGSQELAGAGVEGEDASGLAGGEDDVALFTGFDFGVDPFELRIRAQLGVDEGALVGPILVPVVAGEVLVIPQQLAGVGIERQRRVAVEVGGAE